MRKRSGEERKRKKTVKRPRVLLPVGEAKSAHTRNKMNTQHLFNRGCLIWIAIGINGNYRIKNKQWSWRNREHRKEGKK
jgi:hypothetical protein